MLTFLLCIMLIAYKANGSPQQKFSKISFTIHIKCNFSARMDKFLKILFGAPFEASSRWKIFRHSFFSQCQSYSCYLFTPVLVFATSYSKVNCNCKVVVLVMPTRYSTRMRKSSLLSVRDNRSTLASRALPRLL